MDLNYCLNYLSNLIWSEEIKNGDGCFVPSWYAVKKDEHSKVSDFMYKQFHCTHYGVEWKEKGKEVVIKLYVADAFGAAITGEPSKEFIVNVGKKGE